MRKGNFTAAGFWVVQVAASVGLAYMLHRRRENDDVPFKADTNPSREDSLNEPPLDEDGKDSGPLGIKVVDKAVFGTDLNGP